MAGRVDDVDLDVVIADAGGFGENGDAALALQVVRIHDALGDSFVFAENAALAEHGVDQRGLAVVDVRNDRHVADGGGHSEFLRNTRTTGAARLLSSHADPASRPVAVTVS